MCLIFSSTGSLRLMLVAAIRGNKQLATSTAPSGGEPLATVGSGAASSVPFQDAAGQANNAVAQNGQKVECVIDKSIDRVIMKVVDTQTGQVLRQVPAESMLATARALAQPAPVGALIDAQA